MTPLIRAKVWTFGTVAVLVLALLCLNAAICGAYFQSPRPMGFAPALSPAPRPVTLLPMMPVNFYPTRSFEGRMDYEVGGSFYYTSNYFRLRRSNGTDIDFVDRMGLEANSVLWDIYAAVRSAPRWALTYSFMFPKTLVGRGILPTDFTIGGAFFPAGTRVSTKALASMHRIEWEYYVPLDRKFRAGPIISGNFVYSNVAMAAGPVSGSQAFTGFQMGVGGVIEYARANNVFVKLRSEYTFLNDHHGVMVDAHVKLFPWLAAFTDRRVIGGAQPYLEIGYKYKSADWTLDNKDTAVTSVQAGYLSLGVIF